MGLRLDLHEILVNILGTRNVYFQPPATIRLNYPCIIYKRSAMDEKFANNILYLNKQRYAITIIDSNPDSLIPSKISSLPLTRFDKHFVSDNMNHDTYITFF